MNWIHFEKIRTGNRGFVRCILALTILAAGIVPPESAWAQNQTRIRQSAREENGNGVRVYDVDHDYGTLAFKGRIERTDLGDRYKYFIQIAVVFLPGELTHDGYTVTNRTKVADLKFCDLVATQKVEENKPYKLLHREYHPIAVRLTESGEVGTLPDLEFLMPKSAVEAADHVGLGVSGSNNLYWPIPVELK
jgi:hypothetical protein